MDYAAILIALLGPISAIVMWYLNRDKSQAKIERDKAETRKMNIDSTAELIQATTVLLDPLQNRIKELEQNIQYYKAKIESLENRVKELEELKAELAAGIAALSGQLKGIGKEPVWEPPKHIFGIFREDD